MRRLSALAIGLFVFCLAVPAAAQGVGITSVTYRQYLPGAAQPVTTPFNVSVSAVTCNQTISTAPTPKRFTWDDPDNANKVCVYVDPGTGPLFAKIYGALEATLTNLAGTLESPESPRSPFLHPPLAPTGMKVVP